MTHLRQTRKTTVRAPDRRDQAVPAIPAILPSPAAGEPAGQPGILGHPAGRLGPVGHPGDRPGGATDGNSAGSAAVAAFGRLITTMITPFDEAGKVDATAAEQLVGRLTRDGWNDAVLVNGATGESSATDDTEKRRMIVVARRAVSGTERKVIAGVGSGNTAHSVRLAIAAHEAGADGLLVAAPYYSRPTQSGLLEHFRAIADATPLPVMLYDNPARLGVDLEPETLREVAQHPQIIAVMDATGDLGAASSVMRTTGLAFYSGDDMLNLPWLSVGATGFVSVAGHVVGDRLQTLLRLHDEGRNAEALGLHRQLVPICAGMLRAPAAASAKAALRALGLPGGPVRLPLVDLTEEQYRDIRLDLVATVTELGVPAPRGTKEPPRPARGVRTAGRKASPTRLGAH
jgi:4-hydroxy-tetrahydrodipicolinate synthase